MPGKKLAAFNQRCREVQKFWQTIESSPDHEDVKKWVSRRDGWVEILSLARSAEPDVDESQTFPAEWLTPGNRSLIGVLAAFKTYWMLRAPPADPDEESGECPDNEAEQPQQPETEPQPEAQPDHQTQSQPQTQRQPPSQGKQQQAQTCAGGVHDSSRNALPASTRPETGIGGFGIDVDEDLSMGVLPLSLTPKPAGTGAGSGGGTTRYSNAAQTLFGAWSRQRVEHRSPFQGIQDELRTLPPLENRKDRAGEESLPSIERQSGQTHGSQHKTPGALMRWWARGARERGD